MTEVYTVVGPPGTGKTGYVARQARHAVQAHGPDRVLVCSLTRAAARTAAGRDLTINSERVGTLHALCYRALGRPRLIEQADVDEWNSTHPTTRMTSATPSVDEVRVVDEPASGPDGDRLSQVVDLRRSRREPIELWSGPEVDFHERWSDFKREREAVDFTDLIEMALERVTTAPGDAGAIFVDEAQDLSRLELDLVKSWARGAEQLVVVGDPWQALFAWRGSDPEIFAERPFKVLGESFRVPRAPHAVAIDLIRQSGDWREDVAYSPTDQDGEVRREPIEWTDGRGIVELIESLDLERYRRVMVLASCEYMLEPAKQAMRAAGLAYGNPNTHRWNPISTEARAQARAVLAAGRFALGADEDDRPGWYWTPEEARTLVECMATARGDRGVVLRGKRPVVDAIPDEASSEEVQRVLLECLVPSALGPLLDGDVDFALANMRNLPSLEYALRVVRRTGRLASLDEDPRVVLGTVHSVKGDEADAVVLFPDLSPAGHRDLSTWGWAHRDAIFRMFYVGVTRTRDLLVLGRPAGRFKLFI